MEHAEKGAVMSGNLKNEPLNIEKSRKYFKDLMLGLAYCKSFIYIYASELFVFFQCIL
jgi:hypothetical protein